MTETSLNYLGLNIKKEYRTLKDDIQNDFYIPILKRTRTYDRAVGFFSSSSLAQIADGVKSLAKSNGKIRIVASPFLSENDIEAINSGYEKREKLIKNILDRELHEPLNSTEAEQLNLLANLIADNILDFKIALTNTQNGIGMYHEKMGLMVDFEDNTIAFSGSMNESFTAMELNYETIDVYCGWKNDDKERIAGKRNAFERIWNNQEPYVETRDFPEIKRELIVKYWRNKVDYMHKDFEIDEKTIPRKTNNKNIPMLPDFLELREYQEKAITKWMEMGGKGIFVMATGTGKTYTGLAASVKLFNNIHEKMVLLIVCPYQHLVEQWVEDIHDFNIEPIIGYSSSSQRNYKKKLADAVMDYNLGIKNFFCFICTNATFDTEVIQKQVKKIKTNALLIVDEAHNFGANKLRKTLEHDYPYRLALSATFERYNDDEGTDILKKFFGEICINYSIEEAIRTGMLTEYYYYPVITVLSEGELEEYRKLTKEMLKFLHKDKKGRATLSESGKLVAIKRARLVAASKDKERALLEIMEEYKEKYNILVYCGAANIFDDDDENISDVRQIDQITKLLGEKFNMRVAQFTSRESSIQRKEIIKQFSTGADLQGLIAIKCLDEGINIPSIRTAFILASTTNPKEYIQRRGRVLRLSEGKQYAEIYDFIALPRPLEAVTYSDPDVKKGDIGLIENELHRIIEFKRISKNPGVSDKIISKIIETYELYNFLSEDGGLRK